MEIALLIHEQLQLESLVLVHDQAIYSKAIVIKLKEPNKFKALFLMMGTFHILQIFLGTIGLRFIQSETIAEHSIDSVLRGKQYNRATRCYKLLWEAFWRILMDHFESNVDGKFRFSLLLFLYYFLINRRWFYSFHLFYLSNF